MSNYQSLPKLWTHLLIGDWFGIFVGIEILIGGIGAAGWLWTNRASVRSPKGPPRQSGQVGAYGMILLMVVAGSTTVGALTEDYLIPPPHHVVADGPSFLEFDGKYGATAVDHGRSIDRSHIPPRRPRAS